MKLGIVGFPGLYGGAGVELDDQLTLWHRLGWELHVVPNWDPSREPLFQKTARRARIHAPGDYAMLRDMPVISFCNDAFLRDLAQIKEHASRTVWVNCMSWIFGDEKRGHQDGLIDTFLYQTAETLEKVRGDLEAINSSFDGRVFHSWFDRTRFPFHSERSHDRFRFGRISREDADKYADDQLWIYETMVAPVPKSGIILGFDHRSETKMGKPPEWIRTYPGCGISQQEFYAHSEVIIQKCDTYENWPRVGMEAMASGSLLIVDDRGGWRNQVEHGVTGWLCEDARAFVYYASRAAYEPTEREQMAWHAREKLESLSGFDAAVKSWCEVFECSTLTSAKLKAI